jgi:peptidoglycan/LPS O-acetylase OafA/YrhL
LSFNVNGATWTLQIELLAAPLILFAYIGYRYFKELGLLMFLLAIWLAFRYLPLPSILDTTKGVWTCFALGVLIPTRVGAFVVSLMPRYSWIAAFVVMLGARHLIPDLEISFMVHRCAAALLVALIYYRQAGRLENVLTLPFSKFLGDISYSFYLYAVPPMAVLTAVLLRTYPWIAEHPLEVGIPLGIVVAVVSLPLALASYHWVEKPSIWLGYALTSGPRKVIPA